ncbi:hypothetical protein ACRCUN_17080 [Mycobacterium sp. LTG2003]
MATRTVGVAVWSYRGSDGRRRRGYYGQVLTLTDDEADQGDEAGAFAPLNARPDADQHAGEVEPDADENEQEPATADDNDATETNAEPAASDEHHAPVVELNRPAKTAGHLAWVEYAVAATAHTDAPITRDQADAMSKTELIGAITERH